MVIFILNDSFEEVYDTPRLWFSKQLGSGGEVYMPISETIVALRVF